MSTPEGKVKAKIDKVLNQFGAYFHKPVMNGMGAPTLDYIGSARPTGHFFAIEAKAPGNHPTPRQQLTIQAMRNSGGKVFVIDGDTGELEEWLVNETLVGKCKQCMEE